MISWWIKMVRSSLQAQADVAHSIGWFFEQVEYAFDEIVDVEPRE